MAELGLTPLPDRDPSRHQLVNHFHNLFREALQHTGRIVRFPGTMPMTLSRRHLEMVSLCDYVCLEKSDGTRYMLLAIKSHVVLIDRRMNVYVIDPNPLIMSRGFQEHQDNTILDGELTYNLATCQWDYLIYDAVVIDNDLSVARLGFRDRMRVAEDYVAAPRVWAPFCAGLLRLRIKDYYERSQIRRLFNHIKKDPSGNYIYINNNRRDGVLCNENDGIIFAPVKLGYQLKNSTTLLKWKPPHLNSVDFQLMLTRTTDTRRNEPSVSINLGYKGDSPGVQKLREVMIPSVLRKQWALHYDKFNNSIAEFAYDRSRGEWCYIRQRDDKEIPNYSATIINTLETIAESVEREELVLKMEKTGPPPKDQIETVTLNEKNRIACAFKNDYFDDQNRDYVVTTPISLTAPPNFKPPSSQRNGSYRRPRNQSNGDASARRDDAPSDEADQGRVPFVYNEDV